MKQACEFWAITGKPIIWLCFSLSIFISSCKSLPEGKDVDTFPSIFPDYNGVTIPPNIAPLNFKMNREYEKVCAIFEYQNHQLIRYGSKGKITIPSSAWKTLLQQAAGGTIQVTVYAKNKDDGWCKFKTFPFFVSSDSIDPYIAYRLIDPGYALWNTMGIYQSNIESSKQSVIMENKMTEFNCMNCHSFCMQSPETMLFHMRDKYPSTIIVKDGKIEKLNTKTEQTISFLVYPSWHPGGRFIAFSTNVTKQAFHMNNRNRIEVFDEASDVVIYDVEKHEIITSSLLFSKEQWETFPSFSPDGKTLYFCSATSRNIEEFEEIKYNLCSISFDPVTRSFGTDVDTLYNAAVNGLSASFPRVSPDGKYLLYTLSNYGNFSIWHKDADLHLYDLIQKTTRSLDEVNSTDVESYHSWSSNSKWFVFSSRRLDGLYTRPYFAHIDADGKISKPFLLPQKNVDLYHNLMKSYNIPEFITGKVKSRGFKISRLVKKEKGIDITFVGRQ